MEWSRSDVNMSAFNYEVKLTFFHLLPHTDLFLDLRVMILNLLG